MTKELYMWKYKSPQKKFYFYNRQFINYFNKISKKCWSISKKKSSYTSIKTHNYTKSVLNKKIEDLFISHYLTSKDSSANIWWKNASLYDFSETCLSLKKELFLLKINKLRQYHYFLNENIYSLLEFNKGLIKENFYTAIKTSNIDAIQWRKINKFSIKLFHNNYKPNFIVPNQIISQKINFDISHLILRFFIDSLIELPVINKKTFLISIIFYITNLNRGWPYANNFRKIHKFNLSFNYSTRIKKAKNNFFSNTLTPTTLWKKIIIRNLKYKPSFQNYIWKRTNNLINKPYLKLSTKKQRTFFILPQNKSQIFDKIRLIKKNINTENNFAQILYILLRLEEKITFISKTNKNDTHAIALLKLYNFLVYNITNKQTKTNFNRGILSNTTEIFKIKKNEWRYLFLKSFNKWFKEKKTSNFSQKLYNFYKKLENNIKTPKRIKLLVKKPVKFTKIFYPYNQKKTQNLFVKTLIQRKRKSTNIMKMRKPFEFERLVFNNNYLKTDQIKEIFSIISQKNIKIFYINALSLTKYAFNLERLLENKEKRSPRLFLQTIDRDLINKHKYIGIYIKDLIRICFIGMFFKNARFIAKYIAFQIGARPHNRKETSFIRFIIKVVKTFAAEREEITGFRIAFKGRVNRWRRTKSIIGSRGILPFHTIDNRIECGSAQAINRKGALGIRIWIRYKPSFSVLLKQSILKYFAYSKYLQSRKTIQRKIYFNKKHN